ncbi:MAG TPA: RodZ domain-containing protein [Vicinamibacterales bacterium]|nr:RodZ domain-containing protein [Vicinamibacterales bacterium]
MTDAGIGQTIRDARVRRGITIEELSSVTKINPTMLRAMEAEDLDRLPGGVFTRGFFRTYAREVGLDPEETVARLVVRSSAGRPGSAVEAPQDAAETLEPDEPEPVERSSDFTQMVLIAIIVATVGYLSLHTRSEPTVAASSPAAAAREVPVGTSGALASPEAAAQMAPELRFELQAIGPCWLGVSADGAPVAARLMDAGDSQAVSANEEIRLRIGDPTSVSFTINGVAGRALGDSGHAVSIRITPQNVREFQAR